MTSLLSRIEHEGYPLIEANEVTLLWQGDDPPLLVGDFNDWGQGKEPLQPEKVTSSLWQYQLTLAEDAYIEYYFERDGEWLADPLNPNIVDSGVGHDNFFFSMPGYRPNALARRKRGINRGSVTRHVIDGSPLVVGGKRAVHLYAPPVDAPTPLLVVYDGRDFLRRGKLTAIVDNLIAEGRIQPISLALVQNHKDSRYIEYSCSESTVMFVFYEVLALAEAHLNLIDHRQHPGVHGMMGASMGGVNALYTALRLPEIFGHVLSQSGAFTLGGRDGTASFDLSVYDLVRYGPKRPLKIWMDIGRYDFVRLMETNPRMYDLLVAQGYDVTFREYSAGHNYAAWRNDLWRGLEHLFGA